MSRSEDLINFDIIEGQKENIQSLPNGRSARSLANLFSPSPLNKLSTPTPSDTKNLNDVMRQEYEAELVNISESDDPLDIYDRYVRWTLDAYPSAQATAQSQLLPLLERATKSFLKLPQYKNDPRYLKLWLLYIRFFSDSPRETFAFLARHNIGDGLALFYEEFASWLEGAGRWIQADEVYRMGVEKEARPTPRLLRKYNEFQQRHAQQPQDGNEPSSPALPTVRPALAAKIDPFALATTSPENPQAPRPNPGLGLSATSKSGRQKLAVFSDDGDSASAAGAGGDPVKGWESIGSLAERKKENIMEPKPWVGETLKAGGKKSSAPKMAIFKDQSLPQIINHQIIAPLKEQVTINPRNGKHERIFVNLEAVYPTPDEPGTELSFEELRAGSRGWLQKTWKSEVVDAFALEKTNVVDVVEISPQKDADESLFIQTFAEKLVIPRDPVMFDENGAVKESGREGRSRKLKTMEVNETQIIKTKLSSPSGKKLKRKAAPEPTMTFHTRAATDEIYDLFNQPLKSSVEEEDDDESDQDDGDETDGDYTSGGESTGTGRLGPTSEAGDDETSEVKSVSEWSEFTARKHIPPLDDDEEEETNETQGTQSTGAVSHEDAHPHVEMVDIRSNSPEVNEVVTPVSPQPPRTMFVPIPPEDYVPPTRPYRDPSQVSQNRLPFMTPIAEKTESSLGAETSREEKDYFNSRTPSKENRSKISVLRTDSEELMSSPFQEIVNESVSSQKIPPPALGRITKTNKPTAMTSKAQSGSRPLAKELALAKDLATKGPIIQDAQCNPVDDYTRNMIFASLQPPLGSYEGYFEHKGESAGKSTEMKKFAKAVAKMSKNSNDKTATNISMPPVLRFTGTDREYMVKKELGAGAFAPVYLIESVAEDDEDMEAGVSAAVMGKGQFDHFGRRNLEALKMEDPPTAWEFYIMRQAKRRLGVSRAAESIIDAYEMHLYDDECYLIEEYRDQGTLLDLINLARADPTTTTNGVLDESLTMFFTVELFRTIEALHSKGLLHGDLKADNCLVRLPTTPDSSVWAPRYRRDGSGGWNSKGLALIDFGRGIDMKAFRPDVQFIADWKTSSQDCAEMRELRPWTYQIDYHGLAGIVHSMLFGKYIDTVADRGAAAKLGAGATKTYKIRENLKRYWQTEIWGQVFDLLLNPLMFLEGEEGRKMPLLKGMKRVREEMEDWLEENCEKAVGLQAGLRKLESGIAGKRR